MTYYLYHGYLLSKELYFMVELKHSIFMVYMYTLYPPEACTRYSDSTFYYIWYKRASKKERDQPSSTVPQNYLTAKFYKKLLLRNATIFTCYRSKKNSCLFMSQMNTIVKIKGGLKMSMIYMNQSTSMNINVVRTL